MEARLTYSRHAIRELYKGDMFQVIALVSILKSGRHFHWAAENGVDGFFLQRFVGQCDMAPERDNEGIRRLRDEVGDVVRGAAEQEGRVFAIMFGLLI